MPLPFHPHCTALLLFRTALQLNIPTAHPPVQLNYSYAEYRVQSRGSLSSPTKAEQWQHSSRVVSVRVDAIHLSFRLATEIHYYWALGATARPETDREIMGMQGPSIVPDS